MSRRKHLKRFSAVILIAVLALFCFGADNISAAAKLAHAAKQAQNANQLVRAYMLYAEAAARDPHNVTYRANRDSLAPVAKLLATANVAGSNLETAKPAPAEITAITEGKAVDDFKSFIPDSGEPGTDRPLASIPHIQPTRELSSFELRTDEKSLFKQIATAYGINVIFDSELKPEPDIRLSLADVDLQSALEAATAATNTFIFPVSTGTIVVARDTEAKRDELEPNVLVTVPIPNSLDQRDIIEAANAIRILLSIRTIGWDTGTHQVVIRDRFSRARIAKLLLESVMLPRGQVSIEVQILTVNTDKMYHYGLSLPTSFTVLDFGRLGGFKTVTPSVSGAMNFLTFASVAGSPFGFALANATVFATYSNSFTNSIYDANVVVSDGQTANFHVGDKYPIAQSLFTGYQQTGASLSNPFGQVTLEDLGLILKVTPKVGSNGTVAMDLEGTYKTLGPRTFDTVPTIGQREFKGTVRLREDEWAVLAGIDERTESKTRTGLAGISSIPGINQVLSENTRGTQTENTMILVRPTITRLPVSGSISPQFLLGPLRGARVLL